MSLITCRNFDVSLHQIAQRLSQKWNAKSTTLIKPYNEPQLRNVKIPEGSEYYQFLR